MSSISANSTLEEQFFYDLLEKTKEVYTTSPVYKKYGDAKNWNCAVCETPITKGNAVLFGLNWGGNDINQQTTYPTKQREKGRNWPFAKHADHYLKKYFECTINEVNYSNLCFFRTPNAKYLSYQDWQLSIKLFEKYIDFISPPWTIMMGDPKILNEKQFTNRKRWEYRAPNATRRSFAYVGLLFGKYPFGAVPHSAARCSPETHNALWAQMEVELEKLMSH